MSQIRVCARIISDLPDKPPGVLPGKATRPYAASIDAAETPGETGPIETRPMEQVRIRRDGAAAVTTTAR